MFSGITLSIRTVALFNCWMVCHTEESLKGCSAFSLCLESPWPPQKKRLGFQVICVSTYQWTGQLCLFNGPGLPWTLFRGLRKDIPSAVSWKPTWPSEIYWFWHWGYKRWANISQYLTGQNFEGLNTTHSKRLLIIIIEIQVGKQMETPTLLWQLCHDVCQSIKRKLKYPVICVIRYKNPQMWPGERVKGFLVSCRQGGVGWASSGLPFCPEVLGVGGQQGKALWCHRPARARPPCCSFSQPPIPFTGSAALLPCQAEPLLLKKGLCVMWLNGPDIAVNSDDLFKTCLHSGGVFLVVSRTT